VTAGREATEFSAKAMLAAVDARRRGKPSKKKYPFHPLADVFPLMQGAEFKDLLEDIKANGQLEPIVLYENKILDGRNRYRACQASGVVPTYEHLSAPPHRQGQARDYRQAAPGQPYQVGPGNRAADQGRQQDCRVSQGRAGSN
jgi:ParB-like nuclease domain